MLIFQIISFSNVVNRVQSPLPTNEKAKAKRKRNSTRDKDFSIPRKFRASVNFVMNSSEKHFSPLSIAFEESDVQQGLENMFSLESISIKSEELPTCDNKILEKFQNSVELRDGCYYVDLPWYEDILEKVVSNFQLSRVIAKNVHFRNCKSEISEKVLDVFEEQLRLNIIEPVPEGFNPEGHIWIPNRAVVREGDLVTSTKVRVVFNCSLKTKGAPSLNEAAFPGVNILNCMLDLLQYFRTNKYCMLSDIEKAFLIIRLKSERDKNKFSFVVFDGKDYQYYRYNCI